MTRALLLLAGLLLGCRKRPAAPLLDWIEIPGGSFTMGSPDWPQSRPRHRVKLKTFRLTRTEVTNAQYRACAAAGACESAHYADGSCWHWDGGRAASGMSIPAKFTTDDRPVVCVDWEQAAAFARWAGGRLASEAEWEYAAKNAGEDVKHAWGDEPASCARAVIADGADGCGRRATWPVCSKPEGRTKQGLCDMEGNAWEWTQDRYHVSYRAAPADGRAWEAGGGKYRVARGGAWSRDASEARADFRRGDFADGSRNDYLGFRIALDGPAVTAPRR